MHVHDKRGMNEKNKILLHELKLNGKCFFVTSLSYIRCDHMLFAVTLLNQ